jgi:hypothetical protein
MNQEGLPANRDPEWVVRTVLFMDLVESVRLMEDNENDSVRRWRPGFSQFQRADIRHKSMAISGESPIRRRKPAS